MTDQQFKNPLDAFSKSERHERFMKERSSALYDEKFVKKFNMVTNKPVPLFQALFYDK